MAKLEPGELPEDPESQRESIQFTYMLLREQALTNLILAVKAALDGGADLGDVTQSEKLRAAYDTVLSYRKKDI
jgi:hypothetical protein